MVNGVINAIQNAATSVAMDVTLQASDPRVHITSTPGTVFGLGAGQTANFNVTFTGDGAPRRFDLQFVRAGTNVVLGSIPVTLGTPIAGDNYEFDELGDGEIELDDNFGEHSLNCVANFSTTATSGAYSTGQNIPITLNFREPVTLAGGGLNLTLNSGATLSIAPFSGDTVTAIYTIAAGQSSPLLKVTEMTLEAGASLKDAYGYEAMLRVPAAGLEGVVTIAVNPAAPSTVSMVSVNAGSLQHSRLNTVELSFGIPVNAAALSATVAITLTRTSSLGVNPVGIVVQTGATGANGRILLSATSGMVSTLTLSFDNADGSSTSEGVESGSLADGRWQLAIPSLGYTSALNDPTLRRLAGDSNNDGNVDASDFGDFGTQFGITGSGLSFDFDADGSVDAGDFAVFGNCFGMTL